MIKDWHLVFVITALLFLLYVQAVWKGYPYPPIPTEANKREYAIGRIKELCMENRLVCVIEPAENVQ